MSIAEKLQTISENEQKVYEAGKQAEYDRFWDILQQNGKRTNYSYAFAMMNGSLFKPKYSMQPINATMMFRHFNGGASQQIDLVETFESAGITLDFSKCNNLSYTFDYNANISRIGIVDTRACSQLTTTFQYCLCHTIDKIILKADGSQKMTGVPFTYMTNLKNIIFEGVIGYSVSFAQSSLLTKASITNIISVLSTTTTGQALTLSKTAVNNAFETSEGASDGSTSEKWLNLIATKSNWRINLE